MKLRSLKYYLQTLHHKTIVDELCQIDHVDARQAYVEAISEILTMKPAAKQSTLFVELRKADVLNEEDYINVNIINPDFVTEPDADIKLGLLPWGGNDEDRADCPEGHYNVNWRGFQRYYALSGLNRSEIIEAPIEVSDEAYEYLERNFERIIAEIIYELTFYGYTEKSSTEFWDKLTAEADEIKENLK